MTPSLCICMVLFGDLTVDPPKLEPLTPEQSGKIKALVTRTQDESATLKARLEACQEELMKLYADFNLDEKAVTKKQEEILDAQKRLLANHHDLQVELRMIVGEERFKVLSQRIQRILDAPPEKK